MILLVGWRLTALQRPAQQFAHAEIPLPPDTKTVLLNIGSHVDPILPKDGSRACTRTIAFEALVASHVPYHPLLHVIPAAVDTTEGVLSMNVYNIGGVSSSLNDATEDFKPVFAEYKKNGHAKVFVPALSLERVLRSIPASVAIEFVKSDTQGNDFRLFRSVESELRRLKIPRMMTEVYLLGYSPYIGVQNDLCRDWAPYMGSLGYTLFALQFDGGLVVSGDEAIRKYCHGTSSGEPTEADAFWALDNGTRRTLEDFQYPTVKSGVQYPVPLPCN